MGKVVNIGASTVTVVGVDPSLANWGMCRASVSLSTLEVVNIGALTLVPTAKTTCKSVRASSDDLRRACELCEAFQAFCRGAAVVVAEIPSGCQSARGAMSNGVCLGVLASCPIPLVQVSPLETKLASVGSKTASKAEMIAWATGLYPDADWLRSRGRIVAANEHLADAVGIVHAGVRTPELRQAISMLRSLSSS